MITKISQNGTPDWTKVIDTGDDNWASDIISISDGGYIVAGSIAKKAATCSRIHKPRLIRFSRSGEIIWDRIFDTEGNRAITAIQTHDGGFVVSFYNGEIQKLNPDGKTLWTRTTGNSSFFSSLIETAGGDIIIPGQNFLRLTSDGNIISQHSNVNEITGDVYSVVVLKDHSGYLGMGVTTIPQISIYKTIFDNEGIVINASLIANNESTIIRNPLYEVPEGYVIFFADEKLGIVVLHLNSEGMPVTRKVINGTSVVTLTKDKGYFFADLNEQGLHMFTLKPDGSFAGEQTLPYEILPDINRNNAGSIDEVISTSDGGFVLVYEKSSSKNFS
jgi:hypothetical protein